MPLNEPLAPVAASKHNEAPDYAKQVTDRIAGEYVGLTHTFDELATEALALPEEVKSDADALMTGALIKRLRDLDRRAEAVRELEKEPYLRGGNAVDAFFNGLRDKIAKRNRNDRKAKDGIADSLQNRINIYQEEKAAAERARREAEAAEARWLAMEAARKAAEGARIAEEARLRAERARTEATRAAKAAEAERQAAESSRAASAAQVALEKAEDTRIATLAKTADIVRVRGDDKVGGGVTLTSAQEPFAIVTDRSQLDMAALWPFFTDAEIEKAFRGWARTTGHRVKMAGGEVGFRNKGVTR